MGSVASCLILIELFHNEEQDFVLLQSESENSISTNGSECGSDELISPGLFRGPHSLTLFVGLVPNIDFVQLYGFNLLFSCKSLELNENFSIDTNSIF